MKLGVSINLFDGVELIEFLVKSIRQEIDFIDVCYQNVSNYGNVSEVDLISVLEPLAQKGLVDSITLYEPNLKKSGAKNEIKKRNIGLNKAKKAGCNYFFSMDCDEFYDAQQLREAKKFIIKKGIKRSAVDFKNYVFTPEHMIDSVNDTKIPFITKINRFSKYRRHSYYPVMSDPTRRLHGESSKRFHLFPTNKIICHHMWLVRKDIKSKFNNSSLNDVKSWNWDSIQNFIESKDNSNANFQVPDMYNGEQKKIIKVNNAFNIKF